MKKLLFFISILLLPLLGYSQIAGGQGRVLPDIHGNSRIDHPRRSDNHHRLRDKRLGKERGNKMNDKRRHRHNQRGRVHNGRMS
jgi:hypothetical protein